MDESQEVIFPSIRQRESVVKTVKIQMTKMYNIEECPREIRQSSEWRNRVARTFCVLQERNSAHIGLTENILRDAGAYGAQIDLTAKTNLIIYL